MTSLIVRWDHVYCRAQESDELPTASCFASIGPMTYGDTGQSAISVGRNKRINMCVTHLTVAVECYLLRS
jgi:hypothetical protein